jgi:DNA-binding Xre family transcriptional regulator
MKKWFGGPKKRNLNEIMQNYKEEIQLDNSSDMIKDLYEKEFLPSINTQDVFNLGYSLYSNQWNLTSMRSSPNLLFTGSMGTGKTSSIKFIITDYLLRNMSNTIVFIVDPIRKGEDYKKLLEHELVVSFVESKESLSKAINCAYEELTARKKIFDTPFESIKNIHDYEKTGRQLSRLILAIEGFQEVEKILDYERNKEIKGTTAEKLNSLLRDGRDFGIYLLAEGYKQVMETKSIIPLFSSIIELESKDFSLNGGYIHPIGRGVVEKDLVQFPRIIDDAIVSLLEKYKRPFMGAFLSASIAALKLNLPTNAPINKKVDDPLLKLKKRGSFLIKKYRIDSGLSNKELSRVLGIDEGNLSKITVGEEKNLQKITFDLIFGHLKTISVYSPEISKYIDSLLD